MIALNEIVSNKEKFAIKYKLMGKKCNLDKIVALEQKFILVDRKNNDNRAMCNKLCGSVAQLINTNQPTDKLIRQINTLDKQIKYSEILTKKYYRKINNLLTKLPNLASEDNILNIEIKTSCNKNYTFDSFISDINNISTITTTDCNIQVYLDEIKNSVLNEDSLPIIVKNKHGILILATTNFETIFNNLIENLKNNAKFLILKSIKRLPKYSKKGYFAGLADGKEFSVELVGEFVSRKYMIKYNSKIEDMTKFVNMISITY